MMGVDWSFRQLGEASSEPITLAQAKKHLSIEPDLTDFDEDIGLYLAAAREHCEKSYNVRFMKQRVELLLDRFPCGPIKLPIWPVQSVDYFTYREANGDGTPIPVPLNTGYKTRLYRKPAMIVPPFGVPWPGTVLDVDDPIAIGLTVGFLKGDSPESLPMPNTGLQAIRLMLSHFFENKSAVVIGEIPYEIQLGVDHAMANVRLFWGE